MKRLLMPRSLRLLLCSVMCLSVWLPSTVREVHASDCAEAEPSALVTGAFTSHWDAYDRLACLEESLIARGDRRAIFTSVYTLTTLRMAEAIDADFFEDTAWMREYQTVFANYYRQAFSDYEGGNYFAVPVAWQRAFDAAALGQTLIGQDVLLGMNAHINRDLCYALEEVNINPRAAKHADHTLVNDVLNDVADEIVYALTEIYGSNYEQLDAALGTLDGILIAAGFRLAREGAWLNAKVLDDSRWWNRWLVTWWIESAATGNSELTIRAIGPELRAILAELEGSNPGSTFCQHFTCSW